MSSTDPHIIIIIYCHGNKVWKPPNLSATPLTKTWCILLKSKNVRIVNKTLTTFILYTSLPVQSSVCGWRRSPQRKKSQHFAYESCFGFSPFMFVLLQQPSACCEINMTKLQLYHKLEAQDVLPMCVCVFVGVRVSEGSVFSARPSCRALWPRPVTSVPIRFLSSRARRRLEPIRVLIHFLRGNSGSNGAVVGICWQLA